MTTETLHSIIKLFNPNIIESTFNVNEHKNKYQALIAHAKNTALNNAEKICMGYECYQLTDKEVIFFNKK